MRPAPSWPEHKHLIVRKDLPADLAAVAALSADIHAACRKAGLDEVAAMDLDLAAVEAANNIVVHGYEGKAGDCYTALIAARPGEVDVIFVDRGKPIPAALLESTDEVDDQAESGRGLILIRQCVDELAYSSEGGENRLTLRKRGG